MPFFIMNDRLMKLKNLFGIKAKRIEKYLEKINLFAAGWVRICTFCVKKYLLKQMVKVYFLEGSW